MLEKCYPEWVKPLLLILQQIEVMHPVNEVNAAAKPAKSQGTEQPSKKFVQVCEFPKISSMGIQNTHASKKLQPM